MIVTEPDGSQWISLEDHKKAINAAAEIIDAMQEMDYTLFEEDSILEKPYKTFKECQNLIE